MATLRPRAVWIPTYTVDIPVVAIFLPISYPPIDLGIVYCAVRYVSSTNAFLERPQRLATEGRGGQRCPSWARRKLHRAFAEQDKSGMFIRVEQLQRVRQHLQRRWKDPSRRHQLAEQFSDGSRTDQGPAASQSEGVATTPADRGDRACSRRGRSPS